MLLAGLGAGAVGLAATAAAPVLSFRPSGAAPERSASWWDRTFVSLQSSGLTEWRDLVGQTFALKTANGSHLLKVGAVTAFPASGSRPASLGRSQAFSVVFESVSGPALPAAAGVYRLVHGSYPSLPIFMSAPFTAGRKTGLVAVFN